MRRRRVELSPTAKDDLKRLAAYIVRQHGLRRTARAYVLRIRARCQDLGNLAVVGQDLGAVQPGLRTIPFEGVVVAFVLSDETVHIRRIFRHEQDYVPVLSRGDEG